MTPSRFLKVSFMFPTLTIKTKSTKCTGTGTPVTGCAKKKYYWDTQAQYYNEGVTSIKASIKKLTFTLDGNTIELKKPTANSLGPTGSPYSCPSLYPAGPTPPPGSELGFVLTGTDKASGTYKGQAVAVVACLGGDSGPGTTDNFSRDLSCPATGPTACTIATADIDPADSFVWVQ